MRSENVGTSVYFRVKFCGKLNKNCSNLEPNKVKSFINAPQCHIEVTAILTSVFNQWIHISRGPVCTSHVNKQQFARSHKITGKNNQIPIQQMYLHKGNFKNQPVFTDGTYWTKLWGWRPCLWFPILEELNSAKSRLFTWILVKYLQWSCWCL